MKKIILTVLITLAFVLMLAVSVSAAEKTCLNCGKAYGAPTITTQPDCGKVTNGVLTFTCTCGNSETQEFKPMHLYKGTITTPPTCTAGENGVAVQTEGVMTYTCTSCNKTTTSTIPVTHKHHSEVTVAATHTTTGTMTHICDCGDTYTTELPIVHNFVEASRTVSNCQATITYKCHITGCTVTKTETITQHSYSFSMVETEPTCFFEGVIGGYCTACGIMAETTIAKQHENESQITKAATCTEEGILRHTCLYCDTTHTDIIAASHDYSSGITHIVYADGYTEYGTRYMKCAKCSAEEGLLANPIFTFNGYGCTAFTSGGTVEITCGYTVNIDALAEYQSVMNNSLKFGIVGAAEDHCELLGTGTAPLVSSTCAPIGNANVTFTLGYENGTTGSETINCKIKQVTMDSSKYATVNGRFTGITYEHHTTYFYFCLYVFDGVKTVYISDDSCRDLPLPVSYALLNDNGGSHDKVSNEVSIGGLEYSTVEGTTANADRTTTIQNSINNAKSNQANADSAQNEDTVAGVSNLGNMVGTLDRATELLNYYLELGGDATYYRDFDIEALLNDSTTANSSWLSSINNILRASEALAIEGERVNIDQKAETIVDLPQGTIFFNNTARDLYLSFVDGRYYTDTDVDNLTVTTDANGNKTYTATIIYTLVDYYSFYPYKDDTSTSSFLLWGPTKKELAQLHLDGSALDFLIYSQLTYEVTWTEGQRAGKDSNFNALEGFTDETTGATVTLVTNSAVATTTEAN